MIVLRGVAVLLGLLGLWLSGVTVWLVMQFHSHPPKAEAFYASRDGKLGFMIFPIAIIFASAATALGAEFAIWERRRKGGDVSTRNKWAVWMVSLLAVLSALTLASSLFVSPWR